MNKGLNLLIIFTFFSLCGRMIFAQPTGNILLAGFDFTNERTGETQFYRLNSQLKQFSPDGLIISTEVYSSQIKCEQVKENTYKYTCLNFTVTQEEEEKEIPSLKGWSYIYEEGIDDNNLVFGIDHAIFENLKFMDESRVSPETSYHVYNSFIDFHAADVFAEKTDGGNGIQNLSSIGDKVVHEAAFSQPPVNLGSNVAEGSYFKNGEITLELKGVSRVNDKTCALIQFDSGESSFKMIMSPMPNLEITTVGRSHYYGDIYKDLDSGWVQKVSLLETVISQTKMPQPYGDVNSVIERIILIRNVEEIELTE